MAQSPLPIDDLQKLTDKIKKVQEIVSSILNYVGAVDMMVLMALSTIASFAHQGEEKNDGKGLPSP
jgi:hypothetical protein